MSIPEKSKFFDLELSEPTGGAELGNISRVTVTITNNNDDGDDWFSYDYSANGNLLMHSLFQVFILMVIVMTRWLSCRQLILAVIFLIQWKRMIRNRGRTRLETL